MAHQYEVTPLLSSARARVLSLIDKDNAVRVWRYAVENLAFPHGKTIAYRAFCVVRDTFGAMAATPEKQLDNVDDAGMELLLRSNDLVVNSEDAVLRAVVHRMTPATPQYEMRASWMSLVRWGRLSQSDLRISLQHLDSDAAKAESSKPWVAAYTRGLQDALCMLINTGEARLRAGNIRRGGFGEHVTVVAAQVAAGSGVHVGPSIMVGADLWQLSVDSGGGSDGKGNAAKNDFLPVTLTRLPAADVAEAAGVAASPAVRVKADLFTFELSHQPNMSAPYDNRQAGFDVWRGAQGYPRKLATQSVVLRRARSPTPDRADASDGVVEFGQAISRSDVAQGYYGRPQRAPNFEGRLGVGVSFTVTDVVG